MLQLNTEQATETDTKGGRENIFLRTVNYIKRTEEKNPESHRREYNLVCSLMIRIRNYKEKKTVANPFYGKVEKVDYIRHDIKF